MATNGLREKKDGSVKWAAHGGFLAISIGCVSSYGNEVCCWSPDWIRALAKVSVSLTAQRTKKDTTGTSLHMAHCHMDLGMPPVKRVLNNAASTETALDICQPSTLCSSVSPAWGQGCRHRSSGHQNSHN